jgi:hypothetical protein
MRRDQIVAVVAGMGEGEQAEDLDRGRIVVADGRRWFKSAPLLKRLRDAGASNLRPHELADLLLELGCTADRPYVGGRRVRAWSVPDRWPGDEEDNVDGQPPSDDGE